ncbi:hypothetical protein [Asaia astilbis]|uniref:hypothetical protein n=1 Tax=Asaia astilbis TaxID=610244 RepID=UPI000472684F|nr:hypothetical protein [Asaia astilbis]
MSSILQLRLAKWGQRLTFQTLQHFDEVFFLQGLFLYLQRCTQRAGKIRFVLRPGLTPQSLLFLESDEVTLSL